MNLPRQLNAPLSMLPRRLILVLLMALGSASRGDAADWSALERGYEAEAHSVLRRLCFDCHRGEAAEAEIDLEAFDSFAKVRAQPKTWQKVRDMLDSGQMPPKDADQPSEPERKALQTWVREYLTAEAAAQAGDPGRVVLRRLNNAQYAYTIRDLTEVESLDPAREFPADSAAGEGFTNTGDALVMSPALVTKYLDAAKEIAGHAVLLPDGFRFSPSASRRDWTEEALARIREFYRRHTGAGGGVAVNLQGIQFETNQGGRLPVEAYLAATLRHRDDLASGRMSLEEVARERGLSAKYLETLWRTLTADAEGASPLLDGLRARWKSAGPEDAAALAADIAPWQQALWKFHSIGHINRQFGGTQGPERWMEAATPLAARQEARLKLAAAPDAKEITLRLVATDAGDGDEHDFVLWQNPRLVAPGRADLPLRDLRSVVAALAASRQRISASAAKCLAAAAQVEAASNGADVEALAQKHGVDPRILGAWLECLGLAAGEAPLENHLKNKQENLAGYEFVRGWVAENALSVVANSSDQHVRIPGNLKPHSVAVHPSPTLRIVVSWRSPIAEPLRIEGVVQHAHPECGNGVTWALELRRGRTRRRLASGVAQGPAEVKIGPIESVAVRPGDFLSLVIGPRDGNHSCDLTAIDLTLQGKERAWRLADDVSPDILAANPHPDRFGHPEVWHFSSEPDSGGSAWSIPADSLLARWQSAPSDKAQRDLAGQIQRLLQGGGQPLPKDSPDAALAQWLMSVNGPLLSALWDSLRDEQAAAPGEQGYGLDPASFGKHPKGGAVDANSLCVQAPAEIVVRLPADLVEGCELVATGMLEPQAGAEGSVQLQALLGEAESARLSPALPVIVGESSAARRRFETALDDMRQLFPAALCYPQIVPVDEVITLNLFFREDDHLRRLMLDERQAAELDRLWDELLYVSQEPLLLVSAYEQLVEYATQDRPDKVNEFTPLKAPIERRAAAFRQRLTDSEPRHIESLLEFAARAHRRPLTEQEARRLTGLYAGLRKQEIAHDDAFRLSLARVLTAPAFLYRLEQPGPGAEQRPVSDHELASRLSYFLWSSCPDEPLRQAAAAGQLHDREALLGQMRRMLGDPKARRLASEFAAQWLHIYQFDEHDEKSERHFPNFAALRSSMYQESLWFFADLFQSDRSVLSLLDADHTFVNEDLARHYEIPAVQGPQWRRVDGVKQYARGGILTQAATLAKQSGASRTSPILRGTWLSEVILGEKLPRPPKDVPALPDDPPEGLTERQLIERHSRDPACAKCHVRIDPFGFALERFDAIGRYREKAATGSAIDTQTELPDGTKLDGLDDLRGYLTGRRRGDVIRQFNRKLLGYALGRSVQLSDEPLLAEMESALAERDFRVWAALETIVLSRQFREIRGRQTADQE